MRLADLEEEEFKLGSLWEENERRREVIGRSIDATKQSLRGCQEKLRTLLENERELKNAPIIIFAHYARLQPAVVGCRQEITECRRDLKNLANTLGKLVAEGHKLDAAIDACLEKQSRYGQVFLFPGGDAAPDRQ